MYRTTAFLIGITLFFTCLAQDVHPYIKNIKAEAYNNKLYVSWTTKAGFTCQDIDVELSNDSINFSTKGIYYGICGDTSEKSYSLWIEDIYANQLNYIRLDLGNYGYSYVIRRFVLRVSEVLIIPHPANPESKFYFNNDAKQEIEVSFYNSYGQILNEITIRDNYVRLGDYLHQRGLIIYEIRSQNRILYRGKFLYQN